MQPGGVMPLHAEVMARGPRPGGGRSGLRGFLEAAFGSVLLERHECLYILTFAAELASLLNSRLAPLGGIRRAPGRRPSPDRRAHKSLPPEAGLPERASTGDRKSTRLNSSHLGISYA